MSAAFKFSSRLREIRIHLCQKGLTSNGVREFIQNYYASLKQTNPTCPILIRECEGIQPKLWARFENGVEDVISLSNKSANDILKQIESVAKDGIDVDFHGKKIPLFHCQVETKWVDSSSCHVSDSNMGQKYNFTHLKSKNFNFLTNKAVLDYLMKWSIKGQVRLVTFCFNESFQSYQKNDLVEDFFNDAIVTAVLNQLLPCWPYNKDDIEKIETEVVPCTVSSMAFFDRLLDQENNIVRSEGYLRQCIDDVIDGFMVVDELRRMLIDEESDNYGLFNESERKELIFKVFQFIVLGGKWCQYEDRITPYLDLTKILYKDLLRVERNPETKEIQIKSLCLKVTLIGKNKKSIFPQDEEHLQNLAYLVIDPTFRQITLFAHEYGGQF